MRQDRGRSRMSVRRLRLPPAQWHSKPRSQGLSPAGALLRRCAPEPRARHRTLRSADQATAIPPTVLNERPDAPTDCQIFLSEPFDQSLLEFPSALWSHKSSLQEDRPELVDQGRALTYQAITHAMDGLHFEPVLRS